MLERSQVVAMIAAYLIANKAIQHEQMQGPAQAIEEAARLLEMAEGRVTSTSKN